MIRWHATNTSVVRYWGSIISTSKHHQCNYLRLDYRDTAAAWSILIYKTHLVAEGEPPTLTLSLLLEVIITVHSTGWRAQISIQHCPLVKKGWNDLVIIDSQFSEGELQTLTKSLHKGDNNCTRNWQKSLTNYITLHFTTRPLERDSSASSEDRLSAVVMLTSLCEPGPRGYCLGWP